MGNLLWKKNKNKLREERVKGASEFKKVERADLISTCEYIELQQ